MNDFTVGKVLLVRVGIDSSYGRWNAPVNPFTYEFAYVPIPEEHKQKQILLEYRKSYNPFVNVCERYNVKFPEELLDKLAHLDPDFEFLSYGDENRKGTQIKELSENGFKGRKIRME